MLEYQAANFDIDQIKRAQELQELSKSWEETKAKKVDLLVQSLEKQESILKDPEYYSKKIHALDKKAKGNKSSKCPQCNQRVLSQEDTDAFDEERRLLLAESLKNDRAQVRFDADRATLNVLVDTFNPYNTAPTPVVENHYTAQVEAERAKDNPFAAQHKKAKTELSTQEDALVKGNAEVERLETLINDLTYLYDLSSTLRGEMLKKVVKEVETETNRYLETYFDAEIRVGFTLGEADSLDISIQKSGYEGTTPDA